MPLDVDATVDHGTDGVATAGGHGNAERVETLMKDRNAILTDLGIHLTGAAIVGFVVWVATVIAGREPLVLSTPIVILLAALVSFAVVALVAYAIRSRQLARVHADLSTATATATAATVMSQQLRDAHRRIAEQLTFGDRWAKRTLVASYTVDPSGNDRIESVWTFAFAEAHQGRVFITEDETAEPASSEISGTYEAPGTIVNAVLIVDEPTRKSTAFHFHPPIGTNARQVEVKQTWRGLWNTLRQTGADYYELIPKEGLTEATVLIYIPLAVGQFKWGQTPDPKVILTRETPGAQQTLKMEVRAPEVGKKYRADIVKF